MKIISKQIPGLNNKYSPTTKLKINKDYKDWLANK